MADTEPLEPLYKPNMTQREFLKEALESTDKPVGVEPSSGRNVIYFDGVPGDLLALRSQMFREWGPGKRLRVRPADAT